SLLSTSIQASFLLQRLLDPPDGRGHAAGVVGNRTFVFTDDLDVANRLFDDLRDAEGYNDFGRRIPGRKPLAYLRATTASDGRLPARERGGRGGLAGAPWTTRAGKGGDTWAASPATPDKPHLLAGRWCGVGERHRCGDSSS